MRRQYRILLAAPAFALAIWLIDALLDRLFFYPGRTFLELLATGVPPHEIYARSAAVVVILVFGLFLARMWKRYETLDAAHRSAQRQLATTLLSIGDAVVAADLDARVAFMNPVAERLTGWTQKEARGRPLADVFRIHNEETGAPAPNPVDRVLREGVVVGLANHTVLVSRDGRSCPIDDSGAPIRDESGAVTGVVLVFHDVTEPRAAERRVLHLNLVLRAIRNVNQIITQVRDRQELIQRICASLIETRGYHTAWVALLDGDHGLQAIAHAGMGERFEALRQCFEGPEMPPCSRRALECRDVVVSDVPCACPVKRDDSEHAAMTIALRSSAATYGFMTVTVSPRYAADAEEQALFREVAADVALAIENIALAEQLRRDEEEIRSLAKFPSENPNPVLRIAGDGTVIYANEAASAVIEDWSCRVGEKVPGVWRARIRESLDSNSAVRVEEEHRGRVISYQIAPVRDRGYVNLYGRDETLRKRAEEETRSLAKFPSEDPDPVMRIAADGTLLYANAASDEILRDWACRVGGQVPEAWQERVRRAIEERALERVEEDHRGRVISFRLAPVADEGYVNLYGRDITFRKQSEDALRRAYDYFNRIVNGMHDGMLVVDADLRILDVNSYFLGQFRKTHEEIVGRACHEICKGRQTPCDMAALVCPHREVLRTGAPVRGEHVHVDADGKERVAEAYAFPLVNAAGDVEAAVGLFHDVTERQHLEEQLRQAVKMEAIGRLAGGVAHDFNNLLTAILGYSQMLLDSTPPTHPAHRDLTEIYRAGMQAAALTRQLLAFSRRQVLEPQTLDLNVVVRDIEGILRRVIGEDVRLVTRSAPEPKWVRADRGQIEQVIMNLSANARDAMPEGGTLTIKTGEAVIDGSDRALSRDMPPGAYGLLTVTDTGLGMDAETRSHLFEPFFTTKEVGEGTGLGLSTVYGIVKQSGGAIRVESEPGRGTTFRIYLPRVGAPDERPAEPPAAGVSAHGPATVLVAEDERVVRTLICETLRRGGYAVVEASSGAEALRACESHAGPIHLLLTDIVMPQMSGYTLSAQVAQARPGIKVLFVSGYPAHAGEPKNVVPGARMLQKPFTAEALLQRVAEVLQDNPAEK